MATSTPDLIVPGDLVASLRDAIGIAHTDISNGLREYGQKHCADCGAPGIDPATGNPDEGPCDTHAGDADLVADLNTLLGIVPDHDDGGQGRSGTDTDARDDVHTHVINLYVEATTQEAAVEVAMKTLYIAGVGDFHYVGELVEDSCCSD